MKLLIGEKRLVIRMGSSLEAPLNECPQIIRPLLSQLYDRNNNLL